MLKYNLFKYGEKSNISKLKWLESPIKTHLKTIGLINSAINIDSSTLVGNGKTIQKGFSKNLDSLIELSQNSQISIANLENKEKENSGIKSLKIGFNRVFGYYIEISKSNLSQIPEGYIRKQTLTDKVHIINRIFLINKMFLIGLTWPISQALLIDLVLPTDPACLIGQD